MSSVWAKIIGALPTHLQRLPFQYRSVQLQTLRNIAAQNQEISTDIKVKECFQQTRVYFR